MENRTEREILQNNEAQRMNKVLISLKCVSGYRGAKVVNAIIQDRKKKKFRIKAQVHSTNSK